MLPKFTAELSLQRSGRTYRGQPRYGGVAGNCGSSAKVAPSQLEEEDFSEDAAMMEDHAADDAEALQGAEVLEDGEVEPEEEVSEDDEEVA